MTLKISIIYTPYKSLLHERNPAHRKSSVCNSAITSRCKVVAANNGDPSRPTTNCHCTFATHDWFNSKSHCGWESVSKFWCRVPSRAHDKIFITVWQLQSCSCEAPSLRRGRVCLFHKLLVLASAVFVGSVSLGTHDNISLSQIWDFHFRRLLRLAGSRWRYSTPPPHGSG
jgi:hypothetical protein